jgi:predicted RNA binding protein with dsRBD fold (UPF0201 family)
LNSKSRVLLLSVVNPTEDVERVKVAFSNVFEDLRFGLLKEGDHEVLRAEAEGERGLAKLRSLLRQDRILAAARKVFLGGVRGSEIAFFLNKQVAYAGHVSFCGPRGESPLGPIEVRIFTEDPVALIDWLAPRIYR